MMQWLGGRILGSLASGYLSSRPRMGRFLLGVVNWAPRVVGLAIVLAAVIGGWWLWGKGAPQKQAAPVRQAAAPPAAVAPAPVDPTLLQRLAAAEKAAEEAKQQAAQAAKPQPAASPAKPDPALREEVVGLRQDLAAALKQLGEKKTPSPAKEEPVALDVLTGDQLGATRLTIGERPAPLATRVYCAGHAPKEGYAPVEVLVLAGERGPAKSGMSVGVKFSAGGELTLATGVSKGGATCTFVAPVSGSGYFEVTGPSEMVFARPHTGRKLHVRGDELNPAGGVARVVFIAR